MQKVISVQNVFFRYPSQHEWVIENINFDVHKGEWVAIVGHNGSGKSTLAKLLIGLLQPEQGEIVIEDKLTMSEDNIWDIRKRVGMVFQNPDNQFVGTTVKDDVAFGLENAGIERLEMIKRIDNSLREVKMSAYADQEPHKLSGGQKQRVAIAGILAIQPAVIILDEATSMLDPQGRKEVATIVRRLQQTKNMTVISITHDLEEVIVADRVVVLNEGKIFTSGTPEEVFDYDSELIKIGLDLPFAVLVSKALRTKGIQLTKNYLTQDELVEALWMLRSEK